MTTAKHALRKPKLVYSLLVGTFLLFVVIDAITTWYLVENHPSGIEVESNPVVRQIISEYGWEYMILFKLVGFACITLFVVGYTRKRQDTLLLKMGLVVMLAIGISVQMNNLSLI